METKQKSTKEATIGEGKTMAMISYLTIIGLVIAFVMNNEKKNEFASYHIRQSLGLALLAIALMVINIIPILGWIVSFLGFFVILFLWIKGVINASNSKMIPLPFIGKKSEEWFRNV